MAKKNESVIKKILAKINGWKSYIGFGLTFIGYGLQGTGYAAFGEPLIALGIAIGGAGIIHKFAKMEK